jgi:hypothetical protein
MKQLQCRSVIRLIGTEVGMIDKAIMTVLGRHRSESIADSDVRAFYDTLPSRVLLYVNIEKDT